VAQKAQARAQPTWELTQTVKRSGVASGIRTLSSRAPSWATNRYLMKGVDAAGSLGANLQGGHVGAGSQGGEALAADLGDRAVEQRGAAADRGGHDAAGLGGG
jgi:hypothetical protein